MEDLLWGVILAVYFRKWFCKLCSCDNVMSTMEFFKCKTFNSCALLVFDMKFFQVDFVVSTVFQREMQFHYHNIDLTLILSSSYWIMIKQNSLHWDGYQFCWLESRGLD